MMGWDRRFLQQRQGLKICSSRNCPSLLLTLSGMSQSMIKHAWFFYTRGQMSPFFAQRHGEKITPKHYIQSVLGFWVLPLRNLSQWLYYRYHDSQFLKAQFPCKHFSMRLVCDLKCHYILCICCHHFGMDFWQDYAWQLHVRITSCKNVAWNVAE